MRFIDGIYRGVNVDCGNECTRNLRRKVTMSGTAWMQPSYEFIKTRPAALEARKKNAIGTSRGGRTTKIHARVDALGLLVAFAITCGQVHDSRQAQALIKHSVSQAIIGDKAYDSDAIRAQLAEQATTAIIACQRNRSHPIPYDKHVYKERHAVEIFFMRIKRFRKIATRYAKLAEMYAAAVSVVAIVDWLR